MKLLIYDKYWDSFLKLNKTTQKKAIEFQRKFRENPKSAAIHLEPISTFKDQSLRTARIDQKYRAIIKVPNTGSAYYLVWIDNHDEAMDWARNKRFDWNETTQSMQIFTVPDEEVLVEAVPETPETPEVAVGLGAYEREQLQQLGVPEVLLPSILKVKNLDDLEKMEAYLPGEVFETLFYLLDGANIELLMNEIQEGKINSANPDETATSANNQRHFIELTDDEIFNDILSGRLDKWKYYLHPSQRKYVEGHFNGPVKITGGAGTGKTVAALHRLKFLSGKAKVHAPILFTTYTKALTQNLKVLAAELRMPMEKVRITHIDSLAFELAKEYKLMNPHANVFEMSAVQRPELIWEELLEEELVGYDKAFLEEEFQEVILYHNIHDLQGYLKVSRAGRGKPISRRQRAELWKLFESYRTRIRKINAFHKEEVYNRVADHLTQEGIRPFSHAIVDEIQDFSNVELRFIRSLVEEKPNDLFLVGDPLQTIYNKRINFSQLGINIRGKRSRRLRINYRTSEEIKKLAVSIIEGCHYDNFDGEEAEKNGYISLFHGEKPTYEVFRTKADEVEAVLERIRLLVESGYVYTDIAVASRTKNGLKDLSTALHKEQLPFYESHSGKKSGHASGIHLLTFHSIKGLEFKHVLLVDVNHRSAPKLFHGFEDKDPLFKEQYIRAGRSLLYVAASRAIESLAIYGTGVPTDWIRV